MLYTVNDRQFRELMIDKEDVVNARIEYTAPLMRAIATKWIAELDPGALVLLVWLIGRTVVFGKAAEVIPYRQFIEGLIEDGVTHFAPVQMSTATVKKHLKTLCDDGFINVFRSVTLREGAEKEARMFEINCKKILEISTVDTRNSSMLVNISSRVLQEKSNKKINNGSNATQKHGTPPYNSCRGTINTNTISVNALSGLGKPNKDSPVCDLAKVAVVDNNSRQGIAMLPIAKKPRPPARRSESIDTVIAETKAKHVVIAATRVASAIDGNINEKTMQALLDAARSKYVSDLPRIIVTSKPFGVLKKRLKAAEITDVKKFIDFTIREWTTFAAQNRAAFIKDPSRHRRSSPLPSAPTFDAIAYRMPYFLAAFANSMVSGVQTKVKTEQEKTIVDLRNKVAAIQRESQTKSDIIRRMRPGAVRAQNVTQTKQSQNVAAINDNDDWVPPAWEGTPLSSLPRKRVSNAK